MTTSFFHFFSILVAYLWRTADPRLRGLRADVPQEPPFLVAWQAVANTHKPPCFWDILIIYPMYHVSINSWLGLIIGIYVYTYTENSNLDLWVQLNAFYWIYGDSTIEIYLASVFFLGIMIWFTGNDKLVIWNRRSIGSESFCCDWTGFFYHLPIIVFFSVIKNPR
jgi:hypothetical protein